MRIDAVHAAFPSRRVRNEELVDLIRQHSAGPFEGDLEGTLDKLLRMLQFSGAVERRWLAEGERPIDLITAAARAALEAARLRPDDIGLLIYVGVGKGFVEPAQSYLVAHALGWPKTECFDILDACMSWVRAVHVADSHFRSGRYRHIMVVNGEFVPMEGGWVYPANYRLRNAGQLEWTFPSYTIGSAATATVLSADAGREWEWGFASSPRLADLCTIPIAGWEDFCSCKADRIGRNGAHRFTSFGTELHRQAPQAVELFLKEIADPEGIKMLFTHTSSYREWHKIAKAIHLEDRLCCLYPDHGNLVSASVPAGLFLASEAGRVQRGDRLAWLVGSAGMSFATCAFDY
jgi:3-oxoacyl-[acyl-carrier-protein] synthase III